MGHCLVIRRCTPTLFDCGAIQDLLFMAPRLERADLTEPGMAPKRFVKVRLSFKLSFLKWLSSNGAIV